MGVVQRKLSRTFQNFFDSEKSSGILLSICTIISLVITNSILGANYLSLWQMYVAGLSIEHWINDGLMTIFFLFIGLELERELFGLLFALNRFFRVMSLIPYLLGGALMWFLMLKSGVHATIAGVLLAFTIPFTSKEDDEESPSHRLEHFLHKPVAFIILPIFALCNTGIVIGADALPSLTATNSLGIISGLLIGKPIGIMLLSFIAVSFGVCRLPLDLNWKHVFGAGILGGIGFTMSIFITNLAFAGESTLINASKMAILLASLTAGTSGFLWLKLLGKSEESDDDIDTMDFEVTEIPNSLK